MRARGLHLTIVIVGALSVTPGCERPAEEAFWIPSDATPLAKPQMYADGFRDLSFRVERKDPEEFVKRLVSHFEQRGWRQRSRTTEGGGPTSFDRSWQEFPGGGVVPVDAAGKPIKLETRYWHGEWEDERGDRIAYHLTASRETGAERSSIFGYATYAPTR